MVHNVDVPNILHLASQSDNVSTVTRYIVNSFGIHSTHRVGVYHLLLVMICILIRWWEFIPPILTQLSEP